MGARNYAVVEYDADIPAETAVLDLTKTEIKHCVGCWACWLNTPGRCVHRDLDDFYRNYLAAGTVRFYCEVSRGFVSANLKAVVDRMIPLVLPYISWESGESLHVPRYTKYPNVEVVYRGEFLPGEEEAFTAWWRRTALMMFAPNFSARRDEA